MSDQADKPDETKNEKFRRLGKFHSNIIFMRLRRLKNLAGPGYESSEDEREYLLLQLDQGIDELREVLMAEKPVEPEFDFDNMRPANNGGAPPE